MAQILRQRLPAIEVAALLSLIAGSLLLMLYRPQAERTATYVIVREFTVENRGGEPYYPKNLNLEMALNTTTQRGRVINSTPGLDWHLDAEGNPCASFSETAIQPGHSLTAKLSMEVVVTVSRGQRDADTEAISMIPGELVERYCVEGGPFIVNDPELRSLAHGIRERVGSDDVLKIVLALVDWIDGNVMYRTHLPTLYPDEVLRKRSGDCDEKANLLISLCRILGIPAYLQAGLVVGSNETINDLDGHYRSEGLVGHAWAAIYVPSWGWTPVDLTYYAASADPISHITKSAWSLGLVIQTANIAVTDYIADSRRWADDLYGRDIYEVDSYRLTSLGSETRTVYPFNFVIGVVLACSGTMATATAAAYRRVKSKGRERW